MRVFAVMLDGRGVRMADQVHDRLRAADYKVHELSKGSFLVGSNDLAEEIAVAAGIKGDDQIDGATGVVARVEDYVGFTQRAVWSWIREIEQE